MPIASGIRLLTSAATTAGSFLNGLVRLLPLLLWLAPFALVPHAAAQNNSRFTHIAAGGAHGLALKADGTVVAWGWNEYSQSTVPDGLTGVVAIAAGGEPNRGYSLALMSTHPVLTVQASGDSVVLSWPLWAQGFALQAAPNLPDENSWTPVLTVPVVEGSRNRVTENLAGPAKFYRLRK